MTDPALHPLEAILRYCAAASPNPWYPSVHVKETGTSRDALDPCLHQLRLGGLIRLTEWVQGQGQGYVLTPAGIEVVESPRQLARLARGRLSLRGLGGPKPASDRSLKTNTWDRGEAVRRALGDGGPAPVTLTLIFVNVIVFIAGLILTAQLNQPELFTEYLGLSSANSDEVNAILHKLGALSFFDVIARRQYWRLLTHAFVHFGILHLCMNMFMLFQFGPILERTWGGVRFLVLYVVSALGGGVAVVLARSGGVGASGALCGLLAAMVVNLVLNRSSLSSEFVRFAMRQMLILVVLIVAISLVPGVSAAGHLGGGIAGLATAIALNYQRFGSPWQRWLGLLGIVAVPVIGFELLVLVFDKDMRQAAAARQAQKEVAEFNDAFSQTVPTLMNAASRCFETEAIPLLEKHVDRRDPAKVKHVLEELDSRRQDLRDLSQRLKSAGPYSDDQVETACRTSKEYVDAAIRLVELTAECLQQGNKWTAEQEKDLDKQVEQKRDLGRRWRGLFQPSPQR